jgi:hypothetical protein
MSAERLAIQMGLDIPDFVLTGHYGAEYGTMKPFHRVGSRMFLSGHVALPRLSLPCSGSCRFRSQSELPPGDRTVTEAAI